MKQFNPAMSLLNLIVIAGIFLFAMMTVSHMWKATQAACFVQTIIVKE